MTSMNASSVLTQRVQRLSATLLSAVLVTLVLGCASTPPNDPKAVAKRKAEKPSIYAALSPENQAAVDQGQIKVGMTEDAVYLAWGKPAQVLKGGDTSGEFTTWLFQGTTTDSYHSWRYREYPRRDGSTYLERTMDTDYAFRDYVSAELHFRQGALVSWRMLPKPSEGSFFSPGP